MEVKKTAGADIERLRPRGFLLGLVIAVSAFIAVLELNIADNGDYLDSDFLDEIAEDMDFIPPMDQNLIMPQEEVNDQQSDQVEVVEEMKQEESPQESDDNQQQPELVTETELEEVETTEEPTEQPVEEAPVLTPDQLESLPEFPGGMRQLMKWLTQNLKYPEKAKQDKVSGRVVVSFIINADGTVGDVKLIHNASPDLDREALRVVRMMPKWKPGVSGGKVCRTLVHMPVVFKL